uniref:helix-turn-helix transcriptional regulator n=1 Tax=Limnohabitans sp. TaxID=1907725 RepID=UPI0040485346
MENPALRSVLDDQMLRINDLAKLTTLSKSCINLWVAQGRFPKPITLSKTVKLWSMGSVRKWILDQQLSCENSISDSIKQSDRGAVE